MEYYSQPQEPKQVLLEEDVITNISEEENLVERLRDALFKLRSYSDSTGGEYSLGFESGLEMAAGMIENILNTVEGNNGS